MAGICYGVVGESETAAAVEPTKRNPTSRRRRLELRPFTLVAADVAVPAPLENERKRQKLDLFPLPSTLLKSPPRDCDDAVRRCIANENNRNENKEIETSGKSECVDSSESVQGCTRIEPGKLEQYEVVKEPPKFGVTSVCGGRRDMEDAVSIHPSFIGEKTSFFGVFDGHGCSHVNTSFLIELRSNCDRITDKHAFLALISFILMWV
uniref:Uncharacterized protein n=1 Tax=Rhizophora mucronata TaxID=61149 RepID=A0A2P2JTK0_RHIMU